MEGWLEGQYVWGRENEERRIRDEAEEAKSGRATQCFPKQARTLGYKTQSDERPLKVLDGGKK